MTIKRKAKDLIAKLQDKKTIKHSMQRQRSLVPVAETCTAEPRT